MAMKRGIVKGMSIGYDSIKKSFDKDVRDLQEVKLYEGSIVPWPMNDLAQVTDVKSAEGFLAQITAFNEEIKAGRTISSANLKLIQQAYAALQALLEAAQPSDDTGKDGKPQDNAGKSGDAHSLADLYQGITEFTKSIRA